MAKVNSSNTSASTLGPQYPLREMSSSNRSREADDFQKHVAMEIAALFRNERTADVPREFEDVDFHNQAIRELDDSQPLRVDPPLTLAKICCRLTAVEQLWLVRLVKAHGKELVLARWLDYEVHINYVRYLRHILTGVPKANGQERGHHA